METKKTGKCKHGEFILIEGCPDCMDKRTQDERHYGEVPRYGLAGAAQEAGAEVTVVTMVDTAKLASARERAPRIVAETDQFLRGIEPDRIPADQRALVRVNPLSDEVVIALYMEAAKILSYAKDRQVTTLEQSKTATDDLSIISGIKKRMEACRKEYLSPVNAIKDEMSQAFKTIMEPVLEADTITRGKLVAYNMELRRIQAEQENINRKRMEAAEAEMKLKGEITESVNLTQVNEAPKRVQTDMGTAGMRDNWKYEVFDFAALPDEFKVADGALLTAISRKHHDQKQVAGVLFYNAPVIAVRAR